MSAVADPPELGRMIACCGHLVKQCGDNRLRQAGYDVTPPQSHLLMYLSRCRAGREVSQRELERELRLKPSTVNGIVGRLEEKGYSARRASLHDGRFRMVSLTELGRSKVVEFRSAMEETERHVAGPLSPAEQELLHGLLARIIANLENEVNEK